jgi:ElaB/YqjD/DUF883 family membrane-anchored ribosome-binding protein
MPRSVDAERELSEAREAIAAKAYDYARDAAWRAAAAAAQIGDEDALQEVVDIAASLGTAGVDDVEQLRTYAEACLEDARAGTRPPSMFERLLGRGRRAG